MYKHYLMCAMKQASNTFVWRLPQCDIIYSNAFVRRFQQYDMYSSKVRGVFNQSDVMCVYRGGLIYAWPAPALPAPPGPGDRRQVILGLSLLREPPGLRGELASAGRTRRFRIRSAIMLHAFPGGTVWSRLTWVGLVV
jgi:hypothetical protein